MNLFEWSIPFVCEKVMEMLYNITIIKDNSKRTNDGYQDINEGVNSKL